MSAAALPRDIITYLYECGVCRKGTEHAGPEAYPHKCGICALSLCRECDDRTNILQWYELKGEDKYLCGICAKKTDAKH